MSDYTSGQPAIRFSERISMTVSIPKSPMQTVLTSNEGGHGLATMKYLDKLIIKAEKIVGQRVYAVGGIVRDMLLGRPSKDVDLVTIGGYGTWRSKGFSPIKKDFPVFVHPELPGVELALGRGEKKTGQGYHGFDWFPAETLYQDLYRRDFTVNAMAWHPATGIIDPFKGEQDLYKNLLRHVSDAFMEDPLRSIRAARFAAKLRFAVDDSTIEMMKRTIPELPLLSMDRVREEFVRAMMSDNPERFFRIIDRAGIGEYWFPEFGRIYRKHELWNRLFEAAQYGESEEVRFFVLSHHMEEADIRSLGERLGFGQGVINRRVTFSNWSNNRLLGGSFREFHYNHWKHTRSIQENYLKGLWYLKWSRDVGLTREFLDAMNAVKITPENSTTNGKVDVQKITDVYYAAIDDFFKRV